MLLAYTILLTERHYSGLARKLGNMIIGLNGLSLFFACTLLCSGWVLADTTSWFNQRFLLDSASFAADSVIFVAITTPGYFTRSLLTIPGLILYLVLVISFFVHWTRVYHTELESKPGCYSKQMLTDMWIFASITFAVVIITSLVLGIYNRSSTPQLFAPIKLIILIPTFTTSAELYWLFSDYNSLKPLLLAPEADWTFGQIMPLAMIIGGILYSFWTSFDVDGIYYIFFVIQPQTDSSRLDTNKSFGINSTLKCSTSSGICSGLSANAIGSTIIPADSLTR